MIGFDTNLAVHAANAASPMQGRAFDFVASLSTRRDVAVCELMLVELYLKLRNQKIFANPMNPTQAVAVCQAYRSNASWMLVDAAPVMPEVWRIAGGRDFAVRRIIDVRMALTLLHHGVREFATGNVKDFQGLGFDRVWNPLVTS